MSNMRTFLWVALAFDSLTVLVSLCELSSTKPWPRKEERTPLIYTASLVINTSLVVWAAWLLMSRI